jgi:hypothetical protein
METLRQLQQNLPPLALEAFRLCAWLAFLMAIFVPLERLCALHPLKVFRRSFPTDLAYYFLNSLLPKMLLVLPLTMLAWAMHRVVPSGIYSWVTAMPPVIRFAAALIVADVGSYWGHLRWRFGWLEWLLSSPAFPPLASH